MTLVKRQIVCYDSHMPIQPTNERSRKFRAACLTHGVTMADVAAACRVSESHLSRAVSNERPMRPEWAKKIKAMIGVPVGLWEPRV